ncbi:MAG: Transcriptional regulator, MerR family [Myxococcaceae bacterium]|nr:Transcriptional regulator, MerR family [Myxococcaceae bacterium]
MSSETHTRTTQDGRQDGTHARMRDSELPSKLFFRIGEVATLVGVEPHVLRYWEREFRSIRPTKSAKGQRVYSRKDVENLLRVRDLLYRDGFTIAGAKKRMQRPTATSAATATNAASSQASLFAEADVEAEAAADVELSTHHDGHDGHGHDSQDGHEDREREDSDDELLAVPEPSSEPRHSGVDPMREKLTALRLEVEGFLDELESAPNGPHEHA